MPALHRTAFALATAVFAAFAAHAGEPSDATVAGITGVQGVKHASKQHKTRMGDYVETVYTDAAGKELVSLRPGTPANYDTWKQVAQGQTEALPGVGTDAFAYKFPGMTSVCARSATSAACVTVPPLTKGVSREMAVKLLQAAL